MERQGSGTHSNEKREGRWIIVLHRVGEVLKRVGQRQACIVSGPGCQLVALAHARDGGWQQACWLCHYLVTVFLMVL